MLSVAILEIVNKKTLNVFTHFVSLKSRSELELNNDKFYLEHRILTEHTIPRVTGATSFKEGYFFGAFSILPDTSFLLWTKIYFFGNKTMKFDLFPLFWDQNTVFYKEIYQKVKYFLLKFCSE